MMRFAPIFKKPQGETLPGALPALFALLLTVWSGLPARAVEPGTQYLVKTQSHWTRGSNSYVGYWDYTPVGLVDVNGTLFFSGWDLKEGSEIWRSDGTDAGTNRISAVYPGFNLPANGELTNVNGTLFFFSGSRAELWKSDGTTSGTVMVKDFGTSLSGHDNYFKTIVPFHGAAFFVLNQTDGAKLWKTDGTAEGTQPLKVIDTQYDVRLAYGFLEHQGNLYFNGWKTDGTAEGTVPCNGISPIGLTALGESLYFIVHDIPQQSYGLWKSDGISTPALVRGGFNAINSPVKKMPVLNGSIYFTADDGVHGLELWKSDGSAAGTAMVRDLLSGASGSNPQNLTVSGSQLYFSVRISDGHGIALWKSDGTAAGTVLLREFTPAPQSLGNPIAPYNFMDVNGKLYFAADDGVSGVRLWKSDGTNAGTVRVPSSVADASGGANPNSLTLCGDRLFYTASCSGASGIWAIDLKARSVARNWLNYQ